MHKTSFPDSWTRFLMTGLTRLRLYSICIVTRLLVDQLLLLPAAGDKYVHLNLRRKPATWQHKLLVHKETMKITFLYVPQPSMASSLDRSMLLESMKHWSQTWGNRQRGLCCVEGMFSSVWEEWSVTICVLWSQMHIYLCVLLPSTLSISITNTHRLPHCLVLGLRWMTSKVSTKKQMLYTVLYVTQLERVKWRQ